MTSKTISKAKAEGKGFQEAACTAACIIENYCAGNAEWRERDVSLVTPICAASILTELLEALQVSRKDRSHQLHRAAIEAAPAAAAYAVSLFSSASYVALSELISPTRSPWRVAQAVQRFTAEAAAVRQ